MEEAQNYTFEWCGRCAIDSQWARLVDTEKLSMRAMQITGPALISLDSRVLRVRSKMFEPTVEIRANKDCVQRHFEVLWNRGEIEKIDEFFSQDFTNFGVQYSDVRGMIQHIIRTWRGAFPDLAFQVDSLVGEDDTVMCEVTLSGTHRGDFPLIPPLHGPTLAPNGRRFSVKHIHRFRLKDAKIVEHFAARDDLGMFQQLGHLGSLVPSSG